MGNRAVGKYAKQVAELLKRYSDRRPGSWLSEESGISQPRISRLKNEIGEIDITDAERIAPVFGLSALEFIAEIYGLKDELTLLRGFRLGTDAQRKALLNQAGIAFNDPEPRPTRKTID